VISPKFANFYTCKCTFEGRHDCCMVAHTGALIRKESGILMLEGLAQFIKPFIKTVGSLLRPPGQ
jgi:hypothetical protein